MNASNSVYYDAATYASSVGITASARFEELRKLSLYETPEELRRVVDKWAPPVHPTPIPKPVPEPKPVRWRPCAHWDKTGTHLCPTCEMQRAIAGGDCLADTVGSNRLKQAAGCMAKAEAMFQKPDNRKFVKWRLHRELTKYPNHGHLFDDLENIVWYRVAKYIDTYQDIGLKRDKDGEQLPFAWLKEIVRLSCGCQRAVITNIKTPNRNLPYGVLSMTLVEEA